MDALTQAGIAAAAIGTIIGLLLMVGKALRMLFTVQRKLEQAPEDILGALKTLTDQVSQLNHRMDEHLTWHSGSGRDRVNGGRRT